MSQCRFIDVLSKWGLKENSRSRGRHHPNLRKTSARWGPRRRGDLGMTTEEMAALGMTGVKCRVGTWENRTRLFWAARLRFKARALLAPEGAQRHEGCGTQAESRGRAVRGTD